MAESPHKLTHCHAQLTQMTPKMPQNRLTATLNATFGSKTATEKISFSTKSEGKINHRVLSQWQ